uniref:Uncharacterized protein n=1 Tax=Anguilla anguilla TaxID=7936 RepID=A0A0E9QX02_ANGAN
MTDHCLFYSSKIAHVGKRSAYTQLKGLLCRIF